MPRKKILLFLCCCPLANNSWAQYTSGITSQARAHAEIVQLCGAQNHNRNENQAEISNRPECSDVRDLFKGIQNFGQQLSFCRSERSACKISQLRALKQSITTIAGQYTGDPRIAKYDAIDQTPLLSIINQEALEFINDSNQAITQGLSNIDPQIKTLNQKLTSAEKNKNVTSAQINEIDQEGSEVLSEFLGISLLIDDIHSFSNLNSPEYIVGLKERENANNVLEKILAIRHRLIALEDRQGLPKSQEITQKQILVSHSALRTLQKDLGLPLSKDEIQEQTKIINELQKKRLDSKSINSNSIVDVFKQQDADTNPSIVVGNSAKRKSPLASIPMPKTHSLMRALSHPSEIKNIPNSGYLSRNDSQDADIKESMLLRAEHDSFLSKTIGNPESLAHFVHPQETSDCAIVAAQEVLEILGKIPADHPRDYEDEMIQKAISQGFVAPDTSETPPQYIGDILITAGVPILKHYPSEKGDWSETNSELNSALKKGRLCIVVVDEGVLWNDKSYLNAAHAVLVTGIEVSQITGKLIGYYINDSGQRPPMGGRLVSSEQFLKALDSATGGEFFEVPASR